VVISVTGQIFALGGLAILGLLLNRGVKLELTLATKLKYYPELNYGESLSGIRSLR